MYIVCMKFHAEFMCFCAMTKLDFLHEKIILNSCNSYAHFKQTQCMNLLKFHALMHEIIHEKVHKVILIPNDISCKIHGSLTSSVRPCDFKISQEMMKIKILQSKTDQLRQGDELVIARTGNLTCPVAMLERYMNRTGMSLDDQRYLFALFREQRRVTF